MPNSMPCCDGLAHQRIGLLTSISCPSTPWMAARFFVPCCGSALGRARSLMVATVIGFVWQWSVFSFLRCARIGLVRRSGGISSAELLERPAARSLPSASGEVAASGWLRLSPLQHRATRGRLLEVRPMRPTLRHFSNPGCLSALWRPVCRHPMFGLWRTTSSQRMDCSRRCSREVVTAVPLFPCLRLVDLRWADVWRHFSRQ